MTGYFGGFVAFGNDTLSGLPFSNNTIFIAKYDSSGNALWGRTPGGAGYDFGQSICTDASGNAFVTGYFISSFLNFGGYPVVNSFTGNNDAFIAEYDGNGNALWAQGIGSQGNEYGMGICANAVGDIYLTGYFESYSLNFGGNIFTNNGSADVYLAKLGLPTAIEENSFLKGNVFPNPFNDKLNITVSSNTISEIFLYDISSRQLMQQKFINSVSLNTVQLAKGIYIYEVRDRNGLCKKGKVVKE
jgi:hypothetical protein